MSTRNEEFFKISHLIVLENNKGGRRKQKKIRNSKNMLKLTMRCNNRFSNRTGTSFDDGKARGKD